VRALVLITLLAPLALAGGADEALLRREGIESTASELGAFLRRVSPTKRQQAFAIELARQLGGNAFQRDNACRKLGLVPAAAIAALKEATRSPDPEVRRRAGPLLERVTRAVPTRELYAALRVIADKPVRGLAREVVAALPLCFDRFAVDCAERALVATAGPEDRAFLLETLAAAATDERATAAVGLAALGNPDDDARLRALLDDASPHVQIVAARALADRGDPHCLPALLQLLEADAPSVRTRAAHALRWISGGQAHDYDAYDAPADRTAGALRWRRWVRERPAGATWRRPLPRAPVRHGRTLIALFDSRKVVELDANGAIVWERTFPLSPWVVVGLPSGDRLVTVYQANTLVRYDRSGREVWRRENLPGSPTSVQPLPDGHLLVACGFEYLLIELHWDGRIVWERDVKGKPTGLRQLAGGRRLITLKDRACVLEVDGEGRVLRMLKGVKSPYSAERLASGNTLVCELGGRVSEWNPAGELVWQHDGLEKVYCAQRLPSGRTLIAERDRVLEVRPDGRKRTVFELPKAPREQSRRPNDLWVHRY
jgi:hypothetical protein